MIPGSGPGSNPGQSGLQVALKGGLQHIISITEGPSASEGSSDRQQNSNGVTADSLDQLYRAGALDSTQSTTTSMIDTSASGRMIHFRVYAVVPPANGLAPSSSNLTLEEIGPSMDLILRRRQMAEMSRINASLKRPKTQLEKSRQGKGVKKNIETDEMGDKVGRVHLGRQDLGRLQTRKMKGLKRNKNQSTEEESGDEDSNLEFEVEEEDAPAKKQRLEETV